MPALVVVGAQWGDEGKGKVTDYLAQNADVIVRYQGGNNAGHTIVIDGVKHKLHIVPSGVLSPGKVCVLGNGMVIDASALHTELEQLRAQGIDTTGLRVSDQAHLILPTHRLLDEIGERRRGDARIGTTGRGIGPAYRDKAGRVGVRLGDAFQPEVLHRRIAAHLAEHAHALPTGHGWDEARLTEHVRTTCAPLRAQVVNTPVLLNAYLTNAKRVLLEGAQGTHLDLDHGTYPYVTSSHPTAGGACVGSGIGPTRINAVLGVAKAYATRVGEGPFPTELHDTLGAHLRERGQEVGTTTGRPRRCGWLDLVALRHAVLVNGMTHLAVTKLDVLDSLAELRVCVAYRLDGAPLDAYPTSTETLRKVVPEYVTLPGWNTPSAGATQWSQLPRNAAAYLAYLEAAVGIPIVLVGSGVERGHCLTSAPVW